jgi:site-specific DNA recombinase
MAYEKIAAEVEMIPCALYLRYSSDRQNERSPEDQEAVCRPYMERTGFFVAAVYVDRAKSGATIHQRRDFQRMLADARTGLFKAVCAETTSRYGRDEEDRAAARKRLTFHGVAIMTPADGVVSRVMDGIKAVMDAQQLEDLKLMIRRGMAAVIRDGRHAGGFIYGYRTVPKRADEARGDLEIVPDQAEIVRRIFREYAIEQRNARAIATRLNAEGVSPPRGHYWRAGTVNGHARRKTGILQNEIYCGRLIWNRCFRVIDPDTGKRIWRYNPENLWQRGEAPELRIVSDDLFQAAQDRRFERSKKHGRANEAPRRILSGLLRCGSCGAGMSKKDGGYHGRPRIVCSQMREAGRCDNRRAYYLDDIEHIVVGGLRDQLGTREAIEYFIERCNEERRNAAADGGDRRQVLEAKIEALDRQISRAVAAIIAGRITDEEAAAHLPGLRQQRATLAGELAALSNAMRDAKPQPTAVDAYLRDLAQLEASINAKIVAGVDDAARTIRSLIETVTIEPTPTGTIPGIVVKGRLSSLLGLGSFPEGPAAGGKGGAG